MYLAALRAYLFQVGVCLGPVSDRHGRVDDGIGKIGLRAGEFGFKLFLSGHGPAIIVILVAIARMS